ncbi:MAG: cytochrome c oxidase subunit I [Bacteroidetes bacterium]|nr:cytochrome c oxidase subunit I [Bacteroidota bacterium]
MTEMTPSVSGSSGTVNYLNHDKSIKSWLLTRDHKRIGIMYLVAISLAFLAGGIMAMLIRLELLSPGETIMGPDAYNQAFTIHGVLMIFAFIIPALPAILGNFVIPMQLGAKDVAFPRINLLSFYLYLGGAVITLSALLVGRIDGGWTFYAPYSVQVGDSILFVTMGVFVMGFSSILTGLNFIVTIHKMRAPGLTWNRLPLFVWSIYATAIVQVLATPVIAITVILLFLERLLGIGIFDPALGGDPVLFQHFFWFYSHPAVYVMILPAFGIISDLIATFSRHRIVGYRFVALSSIAIAFLGFLVWGHHMFVSGQSALASTVFSLITYLIGIPTGVKIINWISTMYRGSVQLRTPMIYALIFLFTFSIGGFTGIMLGVLAVDVHLHDTYFIVAHFHYTMLGGNVIAALGGLHFWWPKMTGKMFNETLGRIAAVLVFIGFNLTFFPQFIAGSRGMPRRYFDYPLEFLGLNVLSTYGSWIMAAGFFLIAGYLLFSLFKGKKAPANPWGALTLEWTHTASIPEPHNFTVTPVVTRGAYDYHLVPEFYAGPSSGDGSSAGLATQEVAPETTHEK